MNMPPRSRAPELPPTPWPGTMSGEFEIGLLPLHAVLFPGGLMHLTVKDARFRHWLGQCCELGILVGIVAQKAGRNETEAVGVLAELTNITSTGETEIHLECRGWQRFRIQSTHALPDGRLQAHIALIDNDSSMAPSPVHHPAVKALATAMASIKGQAGDSSARFLSPYRFDDAGWVANRWCEILPLNREAKQRLMELHGGISRLELVDSFLRGQGVLPG
jgi:Lon protease-like protein